MLTLGAVSCQSLKCTLLQRRNAAVRHLRATKPRDIMDTRNAHHTQTCFHTFLVFNHGGFGTFLFPLLYGQQLLLQLPRLLPQFFAARGEKKVEFDMRTSVVFRINPASDLKMERQAQDNVAYIGRLAAAAKPTYSSF